MLNKRSIIIYLTLIMFSFFGKAEANYEKLFLLAMGLLKNLGDGKLRQDVYRSGQFRTPVS
mgnify:CR=1 FL=1